eukprot:1161769-Pelagomonas_calceolata.AAC.12
MQLTKKHYCTLCRRKPWESWKAHATATAAGGALRGNGARACAHKWRTHTHKHIHTYTRARTYTHTRARTHAHTHTPCLVGLCKGYVKELLRHPQGADVMIDLYDVANTQLRNAMVGVLKVATCAFTGVDGVRRQVYGLCEMLDGLWCMGSLKAWKVTHVMNQSTHQSADAGMTSGSRCYGHARDAHSRDNKPCLYQLEFQATQMETCRAVNLEKHDLKSCIP